MSSPAFSRLAQFLQNEMRMSHIYQPLMLKLLLERGGRAPTRDIAAAFLSHDESQLDYYETIIHRMPGSCFENTDSCRGTETVTRWPHSCTSCLPTSTPSWCGCATTR